MFGVVRSGEGSICKRHLRRFSSWLDIYTGMFAKLFGCKVLVDFEEASIAVMSTGGSQSYKGVLIDA
jgi:hypothetical protein